MRRTLGSLILTTVLATGLLTGCGSEQSTSDQRADGSSASPTDTSSPGGNGTVEFTQVALVSETAAGGDVGERATELGDAEAVSQFSEQFSTDAMRAKVASAVAGADVPEGQTLVGAVVSIGCDVPPGVTVQGMDNGLSITPMKVKNPLQECFAAVTTVALVWVDADAV